MRRRRTRMFSCTAAQPSRAQHWPPRRIARVRLAIWTTRTSFGAAQFKRSALPNGPKVVRGRSLSPRGDWRRPSDANATLWLDELARNVP